MADILIKVDESVIPEIARAIMNKTGKSDPLKLPQFASEIDSISSGGSGGSATLNIHYGDTEPSDTSKLWCKCDEPSKVLGKTNVYLADTLTIIDDSSPKTTRRAGVGVVGNKIYLFGGYASGYTDEIRVFDTETEILSVLQTKLPTPISKIGVGVVGNKIYLFGGNNGSNLNTIHVFDTETETLTTLSTTIPNAPSDFKIGVFGTNVYMLGSGVTYKFDTETESITSLSATLNKYPHGSGVGVVGSKIYMFGGYNGGLLNTIHVFDMETETLTSPNSLTYATQNMGCGVIGTKIYLFSGTVSNGYSTKIEMYDTETNTKTTLSTSYGTEGSHEIVCGTVGSRIYIFDGYKQTKKVFAVNLDTPTNELLIHVGVAYNSFCLMNGFVIGVKGVYIGNSDGIAEEVEAYLYQDGSWTLI